MILISNDDSIYANGIKALVDVALKTGKKVVVVAPDKPQSAKSHSISLGIPITYKKIDIFGENVEAYEVSGTPADCVKLAINAILPEKPELVLSGINHGGNFSVNLIYSGTVAAVVEAAMHKIPSIAFSVDNHEAILDFTATQFYAEKIVNKVLNNKSEAYCLNVNLPYIPLEQLKGIKICKQTKGAWFEEFEKVRIDHSPVPQYMLTGRYQNFEPENQDTDVWAIENNYVAIVPIKIDFTDYQAIKEINNWNF